MRIGVLGLQGDVAENTLALHGAMAESGISGDVTPVKTANVDVDGLVIPGGESTTIGRMMQDGLLDHIRDRISSGLPVLGICAGLVILSKDATHGTGKTGQPLLGLLNMTVKRNAFGRQSDSFEADIPLEGLGIAKYRAVFIRSPVVESASSDIETLGRFGQDAVAVRKNHIMATSFHPELSGDMAVHRAFLKLVKS